MSDLCTIFKSFIYILFNHIHHLLDADYLIPL
jgi:hypothetical protein